jgi:TonB family protein
VAESQLESPSTTRLVIRVKLIPREPTQPPARPLRRNTLLLIVGAVAILLSWLGIRTLFKPDPTETSAPLAARIEDSPVVSDETAATSSAQIEAPSVQSEPQQQPDAPPSAINEVIPDVPRSALETIRGTIRVSIRVTIDKQGAVVDAAADDRGPSRYFERLAVESSKKWTFTPADSEEQRVMLVRFNFTRAGVTAHASPPQ